MQAKFNHVESTHPDLPLPNPIYLSTHAACCRVAHLSGAGKYIEKILEDLEDIRVLAKDGSSACLLSFALQPYSQAVVAWFPESLYFQPL